MGGCEEVLHATESGKVCRAHLYLPYLTLPYSTPRLHHAKVPLTNYHNDQIRSIDSVVQQWLQSLVYHDTYVILRLTMKKSFGARRVPRKIGRDDEQEALSSISAGTTTDAPGKSLQWRFCLMQLSDIYMRHSALIHPYRSAFLGLAATVHQKPQVLRASYLLRYLAVHVRE